MEIIKTSNITDQPAYNNDYIFTGLSLGKLISLYHILKNNEKTLSIIQVEILETLEIFFKSNNLENWIKH